MISSRTHVYAAAIIATIALVVFCGWTFEIEFCKRVLPSAVAMNPLTAVTFLLSALSLALICEHRDNRGSHAVLIGRCCAFAVVFIAVSKGVAILGGPDFSLDRLLFTSQLKAGSGPPNVMAPNTAINFALIGNALLLLHSRTRHTSPFVCIAALVCGFESLLALLGYAYGLRAFYSVHTFIPMALHTAVAFLFLSAGVMACQARRGFLAVVLGDNAGGLMARRLLPAAVLVPAFIGWLRLEGQHLGLYDSDFGVALYTVTNMLVFGGLISCNAYLLYKTDAKRARADQQARHAHEELREHVRKQSEANAKLKAIVQIQQEIATSNVDLEATMGLIVEHVQTLTRADGAVIEFVDGEQMVYRSASGIAKPYLGLRLKVQSSFSGLCVSEGKTLCCADSEKDARVDAAACRRIGVGSMVVAPLHAGGQIVGVLKVLSHSLCGFAEEDTMTLQAMAGLLASVIHQRQQQENLQVAKEEADRASYAKSEFLSRMSHELRTPMNAILGFAQVLEMESLSADQQESVGHIISGGRHLLELINEVLDISRIEAGHLTLSTEPVELTETLRETMQMVRSLAADRKITITTPELSDFYIVADRQRLKQALINLASNAIKYNRVGGAVTISCERRGERARITVKDNGVGIRANRMEQLFTPFERLGAEQSAIEGTGLGLAVTKRLVEAMNGTIGVSSIDGVGTTFWLEFPLTESPLVSTELLQLEPSVQHANGNEQRTVLYIEDNLSNLRLIERLLSRRPHVKLLSARDGTTGLGLAQRQLPDLIFLDLNLPDMHGHEVLNHLKNDSRCSDIPVVAISADAMNAQKERILRAGAAEYLTKPLNVKKFFQVLDGSLLASAFQTS